MIAITIVLSFLIIVLSMAWLSLGLAGRRTGGCQCQNSGKCNAGSETCTFRQEQKS
jgi:hypothetical protein